MSEVLAAVLKDEPAWSSLPATTPSSVRRLLRRCLRKDPDRRLHDIADARIEIEEAFDDEKGDGPSATAVARPTRELLPWVLAATLGAALLAVLFLTPPAESPVRRLSIPLEGTLASNGRTAAAISPDGRALAYVSVDAEGSGRILLRPVDGFESTPLPGTQGAVSLFWSPDSEWVGFATSDAGIQKVSVNGGFPVTVSDTVDFMGADWGADGMIVWSDSRGLNRIGADGGERELILPNEGINSRWPQHLPDGGLLVTRSDLATGLAIVHLSRDLEPTVVLEKAFFGRYVPSGHLLFARSGTLFVAPFDLESRAVGPERPVLEDHADHRRFRECRVHGFAHRPFRLGAHHGRWGSGR